MPFLRRERPEATVVLAPTHGDTQCRTGDRLCWPVRPSDGGAGKGHYRCILVCPGRQSSRDPSEAVPCSDDPSSICRRSHDGSWVTAISLVEPVRAVPADGELGSPPHPAGTEQEFRVAAKTGGTIPRAHAAMAGTRPHAHGFDRAALARHIQSPRPGGLGHRHEFQWPRRDRPLPVSLLGVCTTGNQVPSYQLVSRQRSCHENIADRDHQLRKLRQPRC